MQDAPPPSSPRPALVRRLLTVVALAVTMLAIVGLSEAWPTPPSVAGGHDALKVLRSSYPPGPVVIVGDHTGLIWRTGAFPHTDVVLFDEDRAPAKCAAWWILAPVHDKEPWADPVVESAPQVTLFKAGQTRTVALDRAHIFDRRAGIFSLSFWVHCLRGPAGPWAPSDGAGIAGSVEVLPDAPDLVPDSAGSRTLWISSVTAPELFTQGKYGVVRVSVANGTDQPVAAALWVFLSRPGTAKPWLDTGSYVSRIVHTVLSAAAVSSLTLTAQHLPGPGVYQLSVWLHEQRTDESVHEDGVWLDHTVQVVKKTVRS